MQKELQKFFSAFSRISDPVEDSPRSYESNNSRYIDTAPLPSSQDKARFERARQDALSLTSGSKPLPLHFRFDRSLAGEELADALKESLRQQGIDPANVMVRTFRTDRLRQAISRATDRDWRSQIDWNGSADGESVWMQALGIFYNNDVTYVSPLEDARHISGGTDTSEMFKKNAYLFYDKRHLFKVGYASNGFHAFLTSPHQACIGFMSDEGYLELRKPLAAETGNNIQKFSIKSP